MKVKINVDKLPSPDQKGNKVKGIKVIIPLTLKKNKKVK